MVRRLDMDKTQGIEQLFASGMSRRQIARTLNINRKSVDRHLASLESKGASVPEAPIGQAPTDKFHRVSFDWDTSKSMRSRSVHCRFH